MAACSGLPFQRCDLFLLRVPRTQRETRRKAERGEIHVEYADGCVVEFKAPQVVAIDPGHDGWVVGTGPAVLIEFDFESDSVRRLGMPDAHRHA